MKINSTANWLQRQEQRLQHIKMWQRRKVGSDVTELKVKSAQPCWQRKQQLRIFQAKHVLFRRGTKKDYDQSGSFQQAISPVLVMSQVFSVMPVYGVTEESALELNFSWRHIRTWYSLISVIFLGINGGFTIAYAFRGRFNFDSIEGIIFYGSTFLIALAFFNLARKWPKLMQQWQCVEEQLPQPRTIMERRALSHRIKMITLVATTCSLVEHLLSMLSLIYYVTGCPTWPDHPIDSFFVSSGSQLFTFIDYNTWIGIATKVLNVMSTFVWNFNDIFVMAVSVALSARFRQLNEHMLRAVKRPNSENFWIQCRVNYRNLCKLCEAVDDTISSITILCFSNNLYFICGKIMKSLQKKPSFTHTLYFWFSLGFLLMRTLALSLYSAEINDESRRPLILFRGISRQNWYPELKRFSEEVTTDVVALSGMKFFNLTRGMVMSVAGTIVTYELVLLQFNKQGKVNDCNEG